MQKKNIFIVILVAGFMGTLGGVSVSMGLNAVDFFEEGAVFTSSEDSLIAARMKAAPAVLSVNEYRVKPEPSEDFVNSPERLAGGTGFLIDPAGLALTNKHVVPNDHHFYEAFLEDGTRFDVVVEARDPVFDVALIRLVPPSADSYAAERLGSLPFVSLGDSSQVQVGEVVLAIGNSLSEYANTTTAGIVSAKGRKVVASDAAGTTVNLSDLLQTDAAINFGNSGGPLVNLRGEVIALNTALDDEAQGIGFAIPSNTLKPIVESFKAYGEIRRPFLGVGYVMLTPAQIYELGLEVTQGALLIGDDSASGVAVLPGSPAEKAGLLAGDVVLSVNSVPLTLDFTLQDSILPRLVGERVTLQIWRAGARQEVTVELTNLVKTQ